ncbi:hypothetical protein [Sphingomonas profundi]|uniref:hypothetical protein n=1 Tax=Alterirhizorhabdus profundi TaxID=2681549 RepID=UPI0012E7A287|nr:hypothetical protein [Sphingomonas profundi]
MDDDAIFNTLLRDAYVGPTRVTPAEVDALLDRLEGWLEMTSLRRAARGLD